MQSAYGGPTAAGQSFSYFTVLTLLGNSLLLPLRLNSHVHIRTKRNSSPKQMASPSSSTSLVLLHHHYHFSVPGHNCVLGNLIRGPWYTDEYDAWSNISQHAMNSLFALFEAFIPRTNPRPWIHLPFIILILALYLGLAYLTKATQEFYVYNFLNPATRSGQNCGLYPWNCCGHYSCFPYCEGPHVDTKVVHGKEAGHDGQIPWWEVTWPWRRRVGSCPYVGEVIL